MSLSNDTPSHADFDSKESLAPWRSPLSRALHRNRAQAFCRFLQLATVRPDGTPANRTVVFRGFAPKGNQLMFISDRRSEKTDQIGHNPNAEACWYFTKTREQFRISGQLQVVTADSVIAKDADSELADSQQKDALQQLRRQLWQQVSDNARSQFAWPEPKASRTDDASAFDSPKLDSQTPLDSFCLLLLNPSFVDYLSLRGEPQDRRLYKKATQSSAEAWTTADVNP